MSFRSNNSSSTSLSNSTTPSTVPLRMPSHSKLTHHIHDLTLLARTTVTPSYNVTHMFRYTLAYQRQRDRIAAYFSQLGDADFDGVYVCVLEMRILLRLIERGLGIWEGKVDWPVCGLGKEELEGLRKVAYERIDGWVFRGNAVVGFGEEREKEHNVADE